MMSCASLFHAFEESLNQPEIDLVFINRHLKAVEDGIQTYPFFNGPVGFNFESLQQFDLL